MKIVFLALCLATGATAADVATVTPLITKDLIGIPGKEATMVTVEYAPGGSSAEHRHNAHTFVYVLEGSVTMQVKGGKEVTLGAGQTFYESPANPARVGAHFGESRVTWQIGTAIAAAGGYRPGMAGRQRRTRARTAVKTKATTYAGTPLITGQINNAMRSKRKLPVPVSNEWTIAAAASPKAPIAALKATCSAVECGELRIRKFS